MAAAMVVVLLLVLRFDLAPAAPMAQDCDTGGNYTATSTYRDNLKLLSTALRNKVSTEQAQFADVSIGTGPDTVFGRVWCRPGDSANASACEECVAAAFQDARHKCGLADASILYDACVFFYSKL
ncbi:hypothetical protein BRADI_4g14230v3 [Brachypodium distachyon]|uniref:Gnk2-homologous domain-containing protein n=1 Tax=Brachypodium distachyon TaxID=15368 RepID=I1IKK3_BRADI|nr:hypothetical protein BRADI_4g14230v3 [Brachypodium distachyon]